MVAMERQDFTASVRVAAPPVVTVNLGRAIGEGGCECDISEKRIPLVQTRKDGECWIVALCNTDASLRFPDVELSFQ